MVPGKDDTVVIVRDVQGKIIGKPVIILIIEQSPIRDHVLAIKGYFINVVVGIIDRNMALSDQTAHRRSRNVRLRIGIMYNVPITGKSTYGISAHHYT
ncbi:MAG: hypothetical protein QCI82_04465 [Candidatus Thermoplasmatota archaeon]|nr:hypothetical protein [Candidatus Thermoplasmatota archaeon]